MAKTEKKFIKVFNKGSNTYTHNEYVLKPQAFLDIPEELFKLWESNTEFGVNVIIPASERVEAPAASAAAVAELAKENAEKSALIEKQAKELENMQKMLEQLTKPAKKESGSALE